MGDLLLGINAHINRDLPYTLAHVGLVKADGSPRKLDHDKVNQSLDRVIDPLQDELAQRYDPIFTIIDASPLRPTRSGQNNPLAHALVEQNTEAQAAALHSTSSPPAPSRLRRASRLLCAAAH